MKTDQQLKQDVIAELGWDPAVNTSQIGVEVKDGIVTLAGRVSSFTEKWEAEQATKRDDGVKGLAVQMDVNLPGISNRTDADLARSVVNTLQCQSYLPQDAVQVMVEDGWVTLSGEGESNYQRLDAAEFIPDLLGVKGINESIGIKPRAATNSIQADIEAALKRRSASRFQDRTVSVHDGDVTLSGRVQSLRDLECTWELAWRSAGVKHVKNDLKISFE